MRKNTSAIIIGALVSILAPIGVAALASRKNTKDWRREKERDDWSRDQELRIAGRGR